MEIDDHLLTNNNQGHQHQRICFIGHRKSSIRKSQNMEINENLLTDNNNQGQNIISTDKYVSLDTENQIDQ